MDPGGHDPACSRLKLDRRKGRQRQHVQCMQVRVPGWLSQMPGQRVRVHDVGAIEWAGLSDVPTRLRQTHFRPKYFQIIELEDVMTCLGYFPECYVLLCGPLRKVQPSKTRTFLAD